MEAAHPAKEVWKSVKQRHPLLKERQDWTRIQYLESSMAWKTLRTLAFEHGVPALPVHDSIIVPRVSASLARDVLSRSFEQVVGCVPLLR